MVRKLSLAIAVALGVAPIGVTALGLGDIKLHSALNQNLNADIELLSVEQGEISDVLVKLASADAYQSAGIDRPFFLSNLRFTPEQMPDGNSVIRVTSRDPIREPFLNFLIEVNWPKGSLVREYTVLLDPPVTLDRAPAPVQMPASGIAAPRAAMRAEPAAAASVDYGRYRVDAGEYGPTQRNETLWNIAKKVRHPGVSMEQMVMSLFDSNPGAFIDSNINNLRVGRVLRVPSREEVLSLGSSSEARAAFRGQMDVWRADRVTPDSVAGELPTDSGPESEPMAAVQTDAAPPEAELRIASARPQGEGEEGGEDSVGENQDPIAEATRLRQDLITAQEARESALEEGAELQSRVSDLESQLADLQKLLTLKNEQLARLQAAAAAIEAGQDKLTAAAPESELADSQMLQPEIEVAGADQVADGSEEAGAGNQESVSETEQAATGSDEPDTLTAEGESALIESDQAVAGMTDSGEILVESESESAAIEADQAAAEMTEAGETLAESETTIVEADAGAVATPVAADAGSAADGGMAAPAEQAKMADAPQAVAAPELAAPAESKPAVEPEKPAAKAKAETDPVAMVAEYARKVINDPALLGVAIAVVVVFFALLWAVISRRRSSSAEFQESILVNTIDDTESSQTQDEAEPISQTTEETSFLSDFSPSDIDALQDETGEVDPVAEADVYIAYGRYKQAEDLIRQAIEREPQRLELKQKLFEILFATKDAAAFATLAEEANAEGMQQKDPAGWEKVASMGQKLLPSVALFAGAASAGSAQAEDYSAAAALAGDDTTVAKLDDLDLDLEGLGDLDELGGEDLAASDSELDFDLDLDLAETSAESAAGGEDEDTLPDLQSVAEQADTLELDDMRLELPDEALQDEGLDSELNPEGLGGMSGEVNLEDLDLSAESGNELQDPVIDLGDDLAELQEDALEELQQAVEGEPSPATDMGGEPAFDQPDAISLDELKLEESEDDSPVQQVQDSDEINTKLDLARAYAEMGDAEGARSLLEEVLSEGNDVQSGEAKRMIEELA